LLPIVYRRLAEEWRVQTSWDQCRAYGLSVANWPAFPDSADALQYLKQHFKLIVLSNIDNDSFSYSNQKLAVDFDAVYTAEDVGAYKPAARNFDYMLSKIGEIGVCREELLHTAESMFHDHAPANEFGLASCHIYRRHAQSGFGATMTPRKMPECLFRFNSMDEMARSVREELGE
jgi:2-haloalkanoic acid dehalogenase type II